MSENKVEIVCFVDLQGSTDLTEKLGHEGFLKCLSDYHRIGETLTGISGGKYIKNTGDGHLVTFEFFERAIRFATWMQEIYRNTTPLNPHGLNIRIGLFSGVLAPTAEDVFGSAVNQAARVEGVSKPGTVYVNNSIFKQSKTIWGSPKSKKYFTSMGQFILKGVEGEQELFEFDWFQFSKDYPENSLSRLVYEHLEKCFIEAINVNANDLAIPGRIIWPVVPRNLATAIHRGQTEIIRLLVLLGWELTLLIVDCGTKNFDRKYSEQFCLQIQKYVSSRSIMKIDVVFMTDLYNPANTHYEIIQNIFKRVSSELSLKDLLTINNKEYSDQIQLEIQNSATLDFLRPALSIAAVIYLIKKESNKCLIIAGFDEYIQWDRTFSFNEARRKMGVLMNPVLKMNDDYQLRQKSEWPIWNSLQSLSRGMSTQNLDWWVFQLYVCVPNFPSRQIEIGKAKLTLGEWEENTPIPREMKKKDLALHAWYFLDPAR